jgi:hypothetical protein
LERDSQVFTGLEIVGVLKQIVCWSMLSLDSHGGDGGSKPPGTTSSYSSVFSFDECGAWTIGRLLGSNAVNYNVLHARLNTGESGVAS